MTEYPFDSSKLFGGFRYQLVGGGCSPADFGEMRVEVKGICVGGPPQSQAMINIITILRNYCLLGIMINSRRGGRGEGEGRRGSSGKEVWNDAPKKKVSFPRPLHPQILAKRELRSCMRPQSRAMMMNTVSILRYCLVDIVINSGLGGVKRPDTSKVSFPDLFTCMRLFEIVSWVSFCWCGCGCGSSVCDPPLKP